MRTILIVEGQTDLLDLIVPYFKSAGFAVISVTDGESALETVTQKPVDLVLLGITPHGMDGLEVCRQLRQKHNVPIIMITDKSEEIDRILRLELGADDCITHPFSPRELVAKVRALIRRLEFFQYKDPINHISMGNIDINTVTRRVFANNHEVMLTPKEFDLLWFLAQHPGQVFNREQLLDNVWGYSYAGTTRTVDALFKRLRRKLGDNPVKPIYIETIRGIGYRYRKAE